MCGCCCGDGDCVGVEDVDACSLVFGCPPGVASYVYTCSSSCVFEHFAMPILSLPLLLPLREAVDVDWDCWLNKVAKVRWQNVQTVGSWRWFAVRIRPPTLGRSRVRVCVALGAPATSLSPLFFLLFRQWSQRFCHTSSRRMCVNLRSTTYTCYVLYSDCQQHGLVLSAPYADVLCKIGHALQDGGKLSQQSSSPCGKNLLRDTLCQT